MKKNNTRISITLSAFLAVTLFSCQKSGEDTGDKATDNNLQTVEVVHPKLRSFHARIEVAGTAKPNREIIIYAMESGYVKNIRKDIGDHIQTGEIIAELNNPVLSREKEDLESQLRIAQKSFKRLKTIQDQTPALTTKQEVEKAEGEYLKVKSALHTIEQRLSCLQVRAPYSGIITERFVDHGALLQSGLYDGEAQAIVTIQQIDPIRVVIPISGPDAAFVKVGTSVEVRFPELGDKIFKAKVSRISGALDQKSRTMQIEIDLPNSQSKIISGMYAKISIILENSNDVLSLPIIARTMYQEEPHVMVVKDGLVKLIPIHEGLRGTEYFEILNADLNPESLVITKGKGLVKPGQHVRPYLNEKE